MKQQVEIWKDIPGYEGIYQASNLGNIKSVDRIVKRNGFDVKLKGVLLNQANGDGRYYHVVIYKDKKSFTYRTHVLVAMAFLEHNLLNRLVVVNHINGNKLDNNLNNLEVITQRENVSKSKDKSKTHSIYTGVTFDISKGKWKSQISINNKSKHIGMFENELDAYNAYVNKIKELKNE